MEMLQNMLQMLQRSASVVSAVAMGASSYAVARILIQEARVLPLHAKKS
jgi:hypothetical protein